MTPQNYTNEIVLPTIEELGQHRWNRRKAYLACIVTFHLRDHVSKALGEPAGAISNRMKSSRAFRIVEAMALAVKHVVPQNERPRKTGLRAGDGFVRPPAMAGVMMCGVSRLGDIHGGVEIHVRDGPDKGVYDAYELVDCLLREFIAAYPGLITFVRPSKHQG